MTSRRFWPTPTSDTTLRDKKYAQGGKGLGYAVRTGLSISSAEDSPASPCPSQASNKEMPMHDGSGPTCVEFAKWSDRDGCWLKMCQGCCQLLLDGSSEQWSETWPRSGMLLNGSACRRPTWGRTTFGTGSGYLPTPTDVSKGGGSSRSGDRIGEIPTLQGMARRGMWPTPQAHDAVKGDPKRVGRFGTEHGGRNLNDEVAMWPTPTSRDHKDTGDLLNVEENCLLGRAVKPSVATGSLNPTWVEWLMGFPNGWTDLDASETQSSHKSQRPLEG